MFLNVDDALRAKTKDPEFQARDASVIAALDTAFGDAAREYLGGRPSSSIGSVALGGMLELLHGHQAAYLAGHILFGRMIYGQERVELMEEYRIVNGAEAERLLKSVGGA